jgi:hypothetical protein
MALIMIAVSVCMVALSVTVAWLYGSSGHLTLAAGWTGATILWTLSAGLWIGYWLIRRAHRD